MLDDHRAHVERVEAGQGADLVWAMQERRLEECVGIDAGGRTTLGNPFAVGCLQKVEIVRRVNRLNRREAEVCRRNHIAHLHALDGIEDHLWPARALQIVDPLAIQKFPGGVVLKLNWMKDSLHDWQRTPHTTSAMRGICVA